jgi:hypothetical protein
MIHRVAADVEVIEHRNAITVTMDLSTITTVITLTMPHMIQEDDTEEDVKTVHETSVVRECHPRGVSPEAPSLVAVAAAVVENIDPPTTAPQRTFPNPR